MLVCKDCNDVIAFYSGFGVCRCSLKPLQIIVAEQSLPYDHYLDQLIKGQKLLNLRRSHLIQKYMQEAARYFAEQNQDFPIPKEELPYVIGLGDVDSFITRVKKESESKIKPQVVVIPKLFDKYYTGAWFFYPNKVVYHSIHPLGYAFNVPFTRQVKSPTLIYQNVQLALKHLIEGYSPVIGYPKILAHHKLNLTKNFFWLTGDIFVVYSNFNLDVQNQLARTRFPALSEDELLSKLNVGTHISYIRLRTRRIPRRTQEYIFSKYGKIKTTEDEWLDLKGNRLLNFNIRIDEIRRWNGHDLLVLRLGIENKGIRLITEYKGKELEKYIENALADLGYYPIISPKIRGKLYDILIETEKHIKCKKVASFGFLKHNVIKLPMVFISKRQKPRKGVHGVRIEMQLKYKDFFDLRLTPEEQTLAKEVIKILTKARYGRDFKFYFYHPNKTVGENIVRRLGFAEKERSPGFGRWAFLNEHIYITDDKRYPPLPGLIREGKVLAYSILQLLKNTSTESDTHEPPA